MTKKYKEEKPEIVTDEHLMFLDSLRKSGITYTRAIESFLQIQFGLDESDARKVLAYWTSGNAS